MLIVSFSLLLADYGRSVKICDFGTARYLDHVMSSMKGSPAWMAPEVFAGIMFKLALKCLKLMLRNKINYLVLIN